MLELEVVAEVLTQNLLLFVVDFVCCYTNVVTKKQFRKILKVNNERQNSYIGNILRPCSVFGLHFSSSAHVDKTPNDSENESGNSDDDS